MLASALWYVDTPDPAAVLRTGLRPDVTAAHALATQLYQDHDAVPITIGTLDSCSGPGGDQVYIGCYPGLTVVCSPLARLIHPTDLPRAYIRPLASEHTYLTAFDTAQGWGAFAHWERGQFRRSFSATRVRILEDQGLPLTWECPFWAGEHPIEQQVGACLDPQTLPFDPAEFADAANDAWLGFHYHTTLPSGQAQPGDIPVCGFSLSPKGQSHHADSATNRPQRRGWARVRAWLTQEKGTPSHADARSYPSQ